MRRVRAQTMVQLGSHKCELCFPDGPNFLSIESQDRLANERETSRLRHQGVCLDATEDKFDPRVVSRFLEAIKRLM